ncbi:MAG: hypothetical protein L6R00_20255 [Phycisphaerae bacterium]|nr:hypothetical protein [Phycisphaerae bacterium]
MSPKTWMFSKLIVVLLVVSWHNPARGQPASVGPKQQAHVPGRASALPKNDFRFDLAPEPGALSLAQAEPRQARILEEGTGSPQSEESAAPLSLNYELAGPYHLRSAAPEPPGELVIKNIFGWSTARDGSDDDAEYELEIEWGIVPNHELIFEVPVEMGDGSVTGNGDAEVGWHWRLWEEKDWVPAFGMRNFVRLPTGVDSSGVDYEWIGLITKSIVPGTLRFNANPFIKSVNGDNEPDARHFLWGGSLGLDWRVRDDLILVGLYRYEAGEIEGTRDNHTLELGADWKIAEHHKVGFATEIGLDGDSNGPALGAKFSYMISF